MEVSSKPAACAVTMATRIQQGTTADGFLGNTGYSELVHNDSEVTTELDAFEIASGIPRCGGMKLISDGVSIRREDAEKVDSHRVGVPEQQVTIYNWVNQALHFPATVWTDYKHGLYLNLIEAAFVKDLYGQKYCTVDICGRTPAGEVSEQSHSSSCLSSPSWFQKDTAHSDSDSSNECVNRVKTRITLVKQKYKAVGRLHRSKASHKQHLLKSQQTCKARKACSLETIHSKHPHRTRNK